MHEGHRQRMVERLQSAENSLQDHELLEILLFNALPRINTNELAHRLLLRFGSLSQLFRASYNELIHVNGIGPSTASYIRCISLIMSRGQDEELYILPTALNFASLNDCLRKRFKGLTEEVVELYSVDAAGKIRRYRRFCSGESGTVNVAPEDVSRFLTEQQTSGVIAAHNHPYCNSNPSSDDDRFTRKLLMLCAVNNARLLEHLIISPVDSYSYANCGRLDEMRRDNPLEGYVEGRRR